MSTYTFSRMLSALVVTATLFALSPSVFAETKSYTVSAPDGVKIAVQESGNPDGGAIIFIHGLLGSHLNWDGQINSPELKRYRIITYDMRGHGLSGKPTDAKAYTDGQRWAGDLATVIQSSHARKPALVGWSLGGVVISNYLEKYGDDSISGAVYVDGVIELKPDQIPPHPVVYRDLNSPDLKTHLDAVRDFLGLCFHTQPDAATSGRLFANAAMASWDMQRAVLSITVDAPKALGKARVPVLLIYGAQDALVQAKPTMARAMALNPAIQGKLYANSGHAPFIEEPERFNRDLSAFVDTLSQR
ncbi:alpha/beta fold hydrolase [Acerihabitans arboris]|uniref:Alpha/beta fold hydrolase n=1 Tax=Acerihabitans arboris TaxID=2691583 RepID=A0A845SRX3_9GAMM|nr:alpha/beta hydrolase [Acerihabitans arboris]NDL65684.1 alpha/beta fold hydrolase [Acerihabitans arboris]